MTTAAIYLTTGLAVFIIGVVGLFWNRNLVRRALSLNFMATGVFLFLVALGRRDPMPFADPVPHALVLTGIVVAVSTTALLLVLICRFYETAETEGESSVNASAERTSVVQNHGENGASETDGGEVTT